MDNRPIKVPRRAEVFQFEIVPTISDQPADCPQPFTTQSKRMTSNEDVKKKSTFDTLAISMASVIRRRVP